MRRAPGFLAHLVSRPRITEDPLVLPPHPRRARSIMLMHGTATGIHRSMAPGMPLLFEPEGDSLPIPDQVSSGDQRDAGGVRSGPRACCAHRPPPPHTMASRPPDIDGISGRCCGSLRGLGGLRVRTQNGPPWVPHPPVIPIPVWTWPRRTPGGDRLLARHRVDPRGQALGFLCVDGHVPVCQGQHRLPKPMWPARAGRCPSTTD